jgi:hypothetical protein
MIVKFKKVLCAVVVFCSAIGCVNAAESVLKIDFSNDGSNGVKYDASYSYGMKKCSDGSNNMEELASSINSLSKGALSVGSTDREYIDSDMGSYTIGTNDGGTRNLVVLDDVKCGSGLDKLFFNGDVKNPTSVQMNFNRASDMKLPKVKCNDMALLKFKINNCDDMGYMKSLEVDAPTGLFYNVPIRINGGKYNNANSNLETVCAVANKGLNNIKYANGTKYNFGLRYNIPGITDKLGERNLKILDMTVTRERPSYQHILMEYNVKGLYNSLVNIPSSGLFVIDGSRVTPKRTNEKLTRSEIGKYMFDAMKNNNNIDKIVNDFCAPKNDFLTFKIV